MAKIKLTLPIISGGGGNGNTNLSYISSPTQGTVTSDTGSNAIIPLADATNAGLITSAEKANIATALQPGDITQYTDELAQDAVGGILTDTATIDLSYNDSLNTISADVKPNSITATQLTDNINISEFVNDENYITLADVPSLGFTPENVANKQNSLAVDGTGAKYPTVDAVNAGLALKVDKITSTRVVDAFAYGFSPSATGQVNSIAINNALTLGGKINVSIPGIYEIDDTIILPSNTTIEFVKGCTLKHVTPATGRFVNTFKNKGCIDSTPNDSISIIGNGLIIDFNGHDGIEGGVTLPFAYQNGRISFYKVTNFEVSGIYVNDLNVGHYGMYFFEMTNCAYGKINDINLERYSKDGLDFIHCHDIYVKNYRATTGDDGIFMGTGWITYDKSIGDTYNITFEDCKLSTYAGVTSRIITTSWDDWESGRTYMGSSEDASELCVNAGRVYRKTTTGEQVAGNAPVHTTGTVIGADGIGWLVISDTVSYKNDVYNIKYINCIAENEDGIFLWAYESPTFTQNTNTAIATDIAFYDCNFKSDSKSKTDSYSSFVNASCNIGTISFFNCRNSFKENVLNLGYNTFFTIKQNANNNKIKVETINIHNLDFQGEFKAARLIQTEGSLVELNTVNITDSNIILTDGQIAPLVLSSNQNVLKNLNIVNSKLKNLERLLLFNGSNWFSAPIERVVNTVNSEFTNCASIYTHQGSYPNAMTINYNSFGCRFIDTVNWIVNNEQGNAGTMIVNFSGNTTNTPLKAINTANAVTKKIFDLDADSAVLTGVLDNNYLPKSIGNNKLTESLIYDNGSGVGIGTTSPFRKLTLEHAGGIYIGVNDLNNNKYTFGSDDSGLIFFDDTHGRYMAMFDKTTGAFSVDGNISATTYTGGATLTGTPTAPTATVGTNTTQLATTAFVQPQIDNLASNIYGIDINLTSGQSPYTLQLSDANTRLNTSLAFAQTFSFVVPTNAVVPFQIGTKIRININGTNPGNATLSGAGVTFAGLGGGTPNIRHNNSFIITKTATNTWYVEEASLWRVDSSNQLVTNADNYISGGFRGTFEGGYFGLFNQMSMSVGQTISFNRTMGAITGAEINNRTNISCTQEFSPTANSTLFTAFNLSPVINQTGGANGITRSLYINPTLTSAADFRAIEVTSGKVIIPNGNNSNEAVNKGQLDLVNSDFLLYSMSF